MKKYQKKGIAVFGIVALIGSLMLFCSLVEAKVTLRVLNHAGNHSITPLHWAPVFEEKTGIKVEVMTVPFAELYAKTMIEFLGRTAAFDIVMLQYNWLGDYAEPGYLAPLDSLIKKYGDEDLINDWVPAMGEMYTKWKGQRYGLVSDGDILAMYYRSDLFNDPTIKADFKQRYGYELKAPSTLDEYVDVAKFFTETNYVPYGTTFHGARGRAYMWWSWMFFGLGGEWFDEEGEPAINSPAGIKASDTLKELLKYSPLGTLNFGFMDMEEAWLKGRIALFVQWPDAIKEGLYSPRSTIKGKISVAVPPGGRSFFAAGYAYAINADSTHKDEAYQFIRFITSAPQAVWNITNPETGEDCYLIKGHFLNPEVAKLLGKEQLKNLARCIGAGAPDLRIPHGQAFSMALDTAVTRALSGELTSKEALDGVAKEWKQLINRYFRSETLPAKIRETIVIPEELLGVPGL